MFSAIEHSWPEAAMWICCMCLIGFIAWLVLKDGLGVLLAAVALASPAVAQMPRPKSHNAEVNFRDGSRVWAEFVGGTIDVKTPYGTLTVPVKDINRIEFGRHYPPGFRESVVETIGKLGSPAFKDRDDAMAVLLKTGAPAWQLLLDHLADKDINPECRKRCEQLVKDIGEASDEKDLQFPSHDAVHTATFKIVGKLSSGSIKVNVWHFGATEIWPHEIRQVLIGMAEPKTFTVLPGKDWMDTGIDVPRGHRVRIEADGTVDLWPATPGQFVAGPGGMIGQNARGVVHARAGALVFMFGDLRDYGAMVEGRRIMDIEGSAGRLHLSVAPGPWEGGGDPSGQFKVKVTVYHD